MIMENHKVTIFVWTILKYYGYSNHGITLLLFVNAKLLEFMGLPKIILLKFVILIKIRF